MKCFFPVIVFLLCTHCIAKGQLNDDFSDGNLDGWDGDISHFIINAEGQLQLNAPSGSTVSWIYTTLAFTDSMRWDLYFRLDFAPSTSNQLRIYLGLTSPDPATASGYFFEIGASGDQDAIDFKFLDSGSGELISSSTPGLVGSEPVEMKITVIKDSQGVWSFYNAAGAIPELLFSALHDELPLSMLSTFGMYTKYTDTRRDKFFFDDILLEPVQADISAPQWLALDVISDQTLKLIFSESLDPAIALGSMNYLLIPGNAFPSGISVNGNELNLTWDDPFASLVEYTLSVSGLKDNAGNTMSLTQKSFTFIDIATAFDSDILITEFMADPTPVVQLPDAEYIELFNNSTSVFDLSDYTLIVGSSERALPDSLLYPGEYVILTDESNGTDFAGYGKVIVIDNFPSLTNSGTTIRLQHFDGHLIHEVRYTDEWYRDDSKSSGGWSLEMSNPLHLCSGDDNWSASLHNEGGTPGKQNAGWNLAPDVTGPQLVSLYTGTMGFIEITFSESVDSVVMLNENLYSFSPALDISDVSTQNGRSIFLQLNSPLQEGITYTLFPFNATDCLGNLQKTDTIVFGLVVAPSPGDLLINEILFNPASGGSRFIELINVSDKFIDMNRLSIARLSTNDTYEVDVTAIIPPGEIIVLSPDREDILERYEVPDPDHLYSSSLPSWDEESDDVALLSNGNVIDSVTYSSEWHHPVISDQNGVSLERISLVIPASDPSNWHSASSVHGYATPTGVNSQARTLPDANPPFTIINRHFSPNDDGFNDFMLIQFELESGNDVGSIWVYDLEGREIHQILSNETLGTSAIVQWDGRNAEGLVANMGIYLIFVQLWDASGKITHFQESVALVKR